MLQRWVERQTKTQSPAIRICEDGRGLWGYRQRVGVAQLDAGQSLPVKPSDLAVVVDVHDFVEVVLGLDVVELHIEPQFFG